MRYHFANDERQDRSDEESSEADRLEDLAQRELLEEIEEEMVRRNDEKSSSRMDGIFASSSNDIGVNMQVGDRRGDRNIDNQSYSWKHKSTRLDHKSDGRKQYRGSANIIESAVKPDRIKFKLDGVSLDQKRSICRVCGQRGHFAGFLGVTYVDCINKPCYLCGEMGHSTQSCRYLHDPGSTCSAASDNGRKSMVRFLIERERNGKPSICSPKPRPGEWHLEAAILKLHARRVTCLEFHPWMDNIVISGDKHGQIAIWDIRKVFERTVFSDINKWLTNNIKFLPSQAYGPCHCATSSYDGTVKIFDVELGIPVRALVDVNPAGWDHVEEEDRAGRWISFIGLDVAQRNHALIVAGTSKGKLYFLDPRQSEAIVGAVQLHKLGSKIQSVSVNPVDNNMVLTAGNDREARLLDIRMLSSRGTHSSHNQSYAFDNVVSNDIEVCSWTHPRVINSATFSPLSGRKVMTTCQDNRIRVWDVWSAALGMEPDREIVHSHNFSRHLTNFKAEWDPKDTSESLVVIGRFITEAIEDLALHPIDFLDVGTGELVGTLIDPNLTTISPVNKFHPRRDIIISGSSRSLYAWCPGRNNATSEVAEKGQCSWESFCGDTLGSTARCQTFNYFDAEEGPSLKKKKKMKTSVTSTSTQKKPKSPEDSD